MDELTNIWNADDELNDDQLMNYVKNKLTDEEAHNIEQKMAGSSFLNEGVEGLQQFSSSEKADAYAQQLNKKLQQHLSNKKQKSRKQLNFFSWEIIAVIVIIVLMILGYVILEMLRR